MKLYFGKLEVEADSLADGLNAAISCVNNQHHKGVDMEYVNDYVKAEYQVYTDSAPDGAWREIELKSIKVLAILDDEHTKEMPLDIDAAEDGFISNLIEEILLHEHREHGEPKAVRGY